MTGQEIGVKKIEKEESTDHSESSEHDPEGLPVNMQVDSTKRYLSLDYHELQDLLIGQVLPRDNEEKGRFDVNMGFPTHVHNNSKPSGGVLGGRCLL